MPWCAAIHNASFCLLFDFPLFMAFGAIGCVGKQRKVFVSGVNLERLR